MGNKLSAAKDVIIHNSDFDAKHKKILASQTASEETARTSEMNNVVNSYKAIIRTIIIPYTLKEFILSIIPTHQFVNRRMLIGDNFIVINTVINNIRFTTNMHAEFIAKSTAIYNQMGYPLVKIDVTEHKHSCDIGLILYTLNSIRKHNLLPDVPLHTVDHKLACFEPCVSNKIEQYNLWLVNSCFKDTLIKSLKETVASAVPAETLAIKTRPFISDTAAQLVIDMVRSAGYFNVRFVPVKTTPPNKSFDYNNRDNLMVLMFDRKLKTHIPGGPDSVSERPEGQPCDQTQ